jgi:hypothetical protein
LSVGRNSNQGSTHQKGIEAIKQRRLV